MTNIDRLKAMYEELKELVNSELRKEEIKFSCDLTEKKLKECIVESVGKREEELISEDPYERLLTSTVLNCLDYGFSVCIKNEDFKVSEIYREVEFHVFRDDNGIWKINSITIKCDPEKIKEDKIIEIKNCINFFKKSCIENQEIHAIELNFELAE